MLMQRQEARLRELEMWLAFMVVRYGVRTDLGFRLEMTLEEAEVLRDLLPIKTDPRVLVSANLDGYYTLDAV